MQKRRLVTDTPRDPLANHRTRALCPSKAARPTPPGSLREARAMIHIIAFLLVAAPEPAFAQGIFQSGPNARPAWMLQRQIDDLVLCPHERRSGSGLLERDR